MERKGLVKELIRDRETVLGIVIVIIGGRSFGSEESNGKETVLGVMLVLSSWVNGPDKRVGEVVFLVNVQDGHPMSRQDDAMGNGMIAVRDGQLI